MKKLIRQILVLLLIANISILYAEDNKTWYEKAKSYSSNVIDSVKEKTKEYSSNITEISKKSWEATKKHSSKVIAITKEKTKESWEKTKDYTKETIHDIQTDDITFEAFYKESSSIGWITAAVFAVIATAAIVYSGGTAAPALATIAAELPGVATIGSLFGGSGLVGAAATSSGLAFLGAGSMAAGIVVVGSALSFGTGIAIDYATNKALDEYSYSSFVENSKNMMTLPLPKNKSGCDSYKNAMSILKDVDNQIPLSSETSQVVIQKAIEALKIDDGDIDYDEKAKKESLSALLYFISNNYIEAKKHAILSISLANEAKVKHTLPSYIVATSSLYEETFDYNKLVDKYLKYSFLEEPDNPIIPLLLSIHMDRMMYRYSDNMINEDALNMVFKIVSNDTLKDLRLQNYIIVLSRYIISLKLEQQKISSLALTNNKTIKNSPKTLFSIKKSFENYKKLIIGANNIIDALEQIEVEDETEVEAKKQVHLFKELIVQYANDKIRLKKLIQDLESYQASLSVD